MSPAPKRKPQQRARYKLLQERLRLWREEAGLTQRQLGDLLGKPHTFVHKAEVGERRLDPCEWADWVKACGVKAQTACALLFKEQA
ncbi:MAG TPA: helix-turn-helix transcriptional regulator [Phycisphaerales bacterium]|nr:helix-turn-helix transcriptional regulator [Phycisphaerales bacterium]